MALEAPWSLLLERIVPMERATAEGPSSAAEAPWSRTATQAPMVRVVVEPLEPTVRIYNYLEERTYSSHALFDGINEHPLLELVGLRH